MFAYNSFIDTVQNSKKSFVNAFVTEEKIRKPLTAFVDAQTVFTKQICKSFEDLTTFATEEVKKASKLKSI